MYRLVILCLFVQTLSAHRRCHDSHPCHRRHHDYHRSHENDHDFHMLSFDVISMDRKIQRICSATDNHLTETFHKTYYKLTVKLPEFTEEEIKVKIKHRVISVQAVKTGVKVFSEVKILPEQVNPSDASWLFKDNVLSIKMMNRAPLGTEVVKDCSVSINETVFEVPKGLEIDARFGVDETTVIPLANTIY